MKPTFQEIKISEAYESPTNPRGGKFEGQSFDDLVASIKEKGVLVPVIARQSLDGKFEIVAGNRRFRACKALGLKTIPARVEDMDDDQASEVQIIENLQREDIAPVEEGFAYRRLVEDLKYEVKTIADRVGKSEQYVRYRLFLTNLCQDAVKQLKNGEISEGQAVLIAKLSHGDQKKFLDKVDCRRWSVKQIQEEIKSMFYNALDFQPWLKDKEANEAVGPCSKCPPNVPTLFGEVKDGACTDTQCWELKMARYVDWMAKKDDLLKVTKEYTYGEKEKALLKKGILPRDAYETLSTKKKGHCEFTRKAIVAHGEDIGTLLWVCADISCKKHRHGHSSYALTPEEKEKRKKETEKAKKREEDYSKRFQEAIAKVELPLNENQIDALLDFAFYRCGFSYQQPTAKLLRAELVKKEETSWSDKNKKVVKTDYAATLRAWAEKDGAVGKLRAVFALLMPHPSENYMDEFNKSVKKL